MNRRFLLIVNRHAGAGRVATRLGALLRTSPGLMERGRVMEFGSLDEARGIVANAGPGEVPVAVGGDGTVNVLVRVLYEREEPRPLIGVLPLGTGNLLAHEVGVARPRGAVKALLSQHERCFEIMRTSHPDFPVAVMSISAGFEGRFIHRYSAWRRRGLSAALFFGGTTLLTPASAGVQLDVDGDQVVGSAHAAWSVGLYTMKHYGFGRVVLPDADPSDGQGEAVVYRTRRAYARGLVSGVRVTRGDERGRAQDVVYRRWSTATLASGGPMQIDGEPVAGGAIDVRLAPGALRVISAPIPTPD